MPPNCAEARCPSVAHSISAFVGGSFPSIKAFILDASRSNSDSYGVIEKARRSLPLGGAAGADVPLDLCLTDLENFLSRHLAILQPAATAANATAMSTMDSLITAVTAIRRGAPSSSSSNETHSAAPASGAPHGGGGTMAVNNDAIEAVLVGTAHQSLAGKLALIDRTTEAGRRDALTAGFDPKHIYAVRALTFAEAPVIRRDATLAILGELQPYLAEYMNHCLRVDLTTGTIPVNLALWSIVGSDGSKRSFFDNFWSQNYAAMDWYGSTTNPGMLSFQAARDLVNFKAVAVADHYCVPGLVRELAAFGQHIFCVQGWPDIAISAATNNGFTWRSWWFFYADHLERATLLDTKEAQLDWLDHAHEQALAALRLMGELARNLLKSPVDIVNKEMKFLMTWDCAPANALREQVATYERSKKDSAAYHRYHVGKNRAMDVDAAKRKTLPLRSERHKSEKPPKRQREPEQEDNPKTTTPTRSRPGAGALASTVGWLVPKKEFYASGRVYDVPKLAADFKCTVDGKCWPFLLNRRSAENRMACCHTPQLKGHEDATAAAHQLAGLEIDEAFMEKYSRASTAEERAKFPAPEQPQRSGGGASSSGSQPKGGTRAKTSGGQHFGRPARQ